MITENKKGFIDHLKDAAQIFSGGNGFVILGTVLVAIAYVPYRVTTIEEHDKLQDARLTAIEADAAQRRELLASVAATVQSIDLRCRRIEDALIKK